MEEAIPVLKERKQIDPHQGGWSTKLFRRAF